MPNPKRAKHIRRTMFEQDDRCFVCALPMVLVETPKGSPPRPFPPNAATIEHIKELREGGTWRPENLALSHYRCNVLRSRYSLFVKRWSEQVTRGKWVMPAWPAMEGGCDV